MFPSDVLKGLLSALFKKWFGPFSHEEFKKYCLLGVLFGFVVGTYWVLKPLKDSIFGSIVGTGSWFALAKIVSVLLLFPIVALYGKLTERFSRNRMFYVMGIIYSVLMVIWALIFSIPSIGLSNTIASPWRISGWLWYVFVESFGSLMFALFWAFTTDISDPKSSKYGFPLIVLIGQVGGFLCPLVFSRIPVWLGTNNAPLVGVCSVMVVGLMLIFAFFMWAVPEEDQEGFEPVEVIKWKRRKKQKTGFFDGLKLLLANKYLLGIFVILFMFEIIVTFIEFNFQTLVIKSFATGVARNIYLSDWGFTVNLITFLCLFFGLNNIQRWLGIRVALAVVPIVLAISLVTFKFYNNVGVLFWLMVCAKAIGYALNGPTLKQLYVPTTKDVKYKSQAWIETFGARGAKAVSSGINMFRDIIGVSLYLAIALYFSFGLLAFWFFIAIFLDRKYEKAVEDGETVC